MCLLFKALQIFDVLSASDMPLVMGCAVSVVSSWLFLLQEMLCCCVTGENQSIFTAR